MSGPATDASSNAVSDLRNAWSAVQSNPDDFSAWEQLIRHAESADGGVNATMGAENANGLRQVYDSFLEKFPLCFGYWKKYADAENTISGPDIAEKVFERGVAAIENSVDLWAHYCDFMSHKGANDAEMRALFERGATNVGLDFMAHTFWDKYVAFEESRNEQDHRLLALLDRIVRVPMHQYARYYEKWQKLCASLPPAQVVDALTLSQYEEEVRATPNADGSVNKSSSEIEAGMKTKIEQVNSAVYTKTQEDTNKRWVFEAEIKRPYFHVKPLDEAQLSNWRNYLDFEEAAGDSLRIKTLYKRCLVACAFYEEFWLRYTDWLEKSRQYEEALASFERSLSKFVTADKSAIRLSYALALEAHGEPQQARDVYSQVLQQAHNNVEAIVKYAHFERRQTQQSLQKSIEPYLQVEPLSGREKAFLKVQIAKYFHQSGQIAEAREYYSATTKDHPSSIYAWLNYMKFELSFYDSEVDARVRNLYKEIIAVNLSTTDILLIKTLYEEYLQERAFDGKELRSVAADISRNRTANLGNGAATKRPAETDRGQPLVKQGRYDAASMAATGPYIGYPSGGYNPTYAPTTQDVQQYAYGYGYNANANQYQ